jgi:protein TonB
LWRRTSRPESAEKDKQKAAPKQDEKQEQVQTVTTPPPKLPPRVVIPSKNQVEWPPGFIKLSREDIAKADISKIKPAGGGGSNGASAGGRRCRRDRQRPGRRARQIPTGKSPHDPMTRNFSPDMGATRADSRGRGRRSVRHTVERYHVEDCRREVDGARADRDWPAHCGRRRGSFRDGLLAACGTARRWSAPWVSIRFTWPAPEARAGTARARN